ncbi:tricarballylate utilization 4Fe-4S protein TcuB [Azospirillum argentinense]
MRTTEALEDARRAMEICNACRYCEGFCAVFPAMEKRREFSNGDLSYLANLCHNCRGCYHACQYAPPHEFGINLPKSFAELRVETYEEYAWPRPVAGLLRRNGLVVSIVTALALAGVLFGAMLLQAPDRLYGVHTGPGAFYAVIPHNVMAALGSVTFLFALFALGMGFANFWRDTGGRASELTRGRPLRRALSDVLTLRHLGGQHGCNDRDETFSTARRRFHHALFYGFFACFASTGVATLYHVLFGWEAPYGLFSLPVLLGTFGGLGMTVGAAGMLWLKLTGDQVPTAKRLMGTDVALLALLAMTAITGLLLLALRATGAMGIALAIHLGFVLSLFLLMPYSKFVHGVYRSAALLRYALEREPAAAAAPAAVEPPIDIVQLARAPGAKENTPPFGRSAPNPAVGD